MELVYVGSGSGAILYAHWGAAQCLMDNKIFPSSLVGTSGGAVAFGPISNGMKPKDCLNIALELLPKNVMSFNWKMLFKNHWGLYSLDGLEKALKKYVPDKFCKCLIPLYVVTTDLKTKAKRVFDPDTTPTMSVAKAIRMSASVPFLFDFVPYDDTIFTDGGVVDNYAIDLIVPDSIDLTKQKAIGFRLLSTGERKQEKPKNFLEASIAVLGSMMAEIERKHIEDASLWSRTINIHVPWNSMDFLNITQEKIEEIYQVGYDTVQKKLDSGWNPAEA